MVVRPIRMSQHKAQLPRLICIDVIGAVSQNYMWEQLCSVNYLPCTTQCTFAHQQLQSLSSCEINPQLRIYTALHGCHNVLTQRGRLLAEGESAVASSISCTLCLLFSGINRVGRRIREATCGTLLVEFRRLPQKTRRCCQYR